MAAEVYISKFGRGRPIMWIAISLFPLTISGYMLFAIQHKMTINQSFMIVFQDLPLMMYSIVGITLLLVGTYCLVLAHNSWFIMCKYTITDTTIESYDPIFKSNKHMKYDDITKIKPIKISVRHKGIYDIHGYCLIDAKGHRFMIPAELPNVHHFTEQVTSITDPYIFNTFKSNTNNPLESENDRQEFTQDT